MVVLACVSRRLHSSNWFHVVDELHLQALKLWHSQACCHGHYAKVTARSVHGCGVVCVCVCTGMSVQKITVLGVKKECVWCEYVCSMCVCVHRFMCQYRKSLLWVLKRSVCGVTVCRMHVCVCVCLGWGMYVCQEMTSWCLAINTAIV